MNSLRELANAAQELLDAIEAYNAPRTAADRLHQTGRYVAAYKSLRAVLADAQAELAETKQTMLLLEATS